MELFLALHQWDQEKLAELLLRLPNEVKVREVTSLPEQGLRITQRFPRAAAAFAVTCRSDFYGELRFPSASSCELTVDEQHPDLDQRYDEYKVTFADPTAVRALYAAISFGRPEKEFRAQYGAVGTTFEGKRARLFSYYFRCSAERCAIKFSKLAPVKTPLSRLKLDLE